MNFLCNIKKYVNVNIRSRERMVQRTNGSRNECSRERMVPRMKVPSWERMLQGTNSLGNEYSSILWNHQITLLVDVFPLIIILWMDSFWAAMAEWLRRFTSTWQTWFETCCRPYGSGSPGKWPLKWRGRERERERERERCPSCRWTNSVKALNPAETLWNCCWNISCDFCSMLLVCIILVTTIPLCK